LRAVGSLPHRPLPTAQRRQPKIRESGLQLDRVFWAFFNPVGAGGFRPYKNLRFLKWQC
jgi:hypothetical protein